MPWTATRLTDRLGIEYPIVQAPMSGSTPPALVAAASNAGGLGSLGAARMGPDELGEAIREIKRLTDRPFNVNLFAWREPESPSREKVRTVESVLRPHRRALGLPEDEPAAFPPSLTELLRSQLAVVREERVPVFSFTLGVPAFEEVKETGAVVLGTATNVAEALALETAGVDMVVAQGAEAGGHRGTFLGAFEDSLIGTMALVPQVVDAVQLPVIAAGGIMDGRGVAAALALGASGAQVGTAFLPCRESGAPESYRRAVLECADTDTRVTAAYTGRAARGIRTPLLADLEQLPRALDFPLQAALTGPINAAATERGDTERMIMLAGQAAALSRPLAAGDLVQALVRETEAAIAELGAPG